MNKIHHTVVAVAALFLLSCLPVMPASAQDSKCVPDIRLKIKVYLEGALTSIPPPSMRDPERKPAAEFRDCDECPLMTVVPSGSFCMGSPMDESQEADERPVHKVTIRRPFAVGVHEITFDEWDACIEDGECNGYRPSTNTWGGGSRPVIHVSWHDAQAYVKWLSQKTEKPYRLLTEAEWEYAARAGTTTPFHFGSTITTSQANHNSVFGRTTPVGSYEPNRFGLHDVHGNAWEWVEDCWHENYVSAPSDGSAWLEDHGGDCDLRVLRGGSWRHRPQDLRSADRFRRHADDRVNPYGFRVARTLNP